MRLLTPENPRQLSAELRRARSPDMRRRRGIIALSLLAGACTAVVACYQSGLVRHVPEPRLRRFNADRVDAIPEAYSFLSTPDSFLALLSYSLTALLAAMGGADRARSRPLLPLALMGKIAVDCAMAGWLTWFQWSRLRAFCSWCLLTTAATFASLPLALPEARRALGAIKGRH